MWRVTLSKTMAKSVYFDIVAIYCLLDLLCLACQLQRIQPCLEVLLCFRVSSFILALLV